MENCRKTWMKQQTALQAMLERTPTPNSGLELLLSQHARLLLMPATRHNFVHLNEAANQVKKLG